MSGTFPGDDRNGGLVAVLSFGGDGTARNWSRITAGVLLLDLAWLLIALPALGGAGIDARQIIFPWIGVVSLAVLALGFARWLVVILPLAAVLGVGSAVFWGIAAAGFTYPLGFVPFVVFSLAATLTAIQGWVKLRSRMN